VAQQGGETAARELLPAIDLNLFIRLMGQSTTNTGPYKWQISLPARAVRRVLRGHAYLNNVEKYCKPFTVLGSHHFDSVHGPALFVANHSSFMDGSALYAALPGRYRGKVAWPAAADRFFIKGRKQPNRQGWWFSLIYNSFPLVRGGGSGALDYTDWLIGKGWSIVIFPEGARTSAGKLARFRMGPAILASRHGLPVVPMYMEGLGAIRPKGTREMTPGPVVVRIGAPLQFTRGGDAREASRRIYHAVDDLRLEAAEARRAARAAAEPENLGTAAG
jgi:1-acyl-sn-glycerol-3-phosphate acyltransferase